LRIICEDASIEKVALDSKKIALWLKERGMALRGVRFDMVLAKYLISAHEKNYDPAAIASEYAGKTGKPEDAIKRAFEIENAMLKKIDQMKLRDVLMTMELPLVPILVEMEWRGVRIDVPYLAALSKETNAKSGILTKRIYELAGEEFNINSPSQVARIVFDKLQLLGKGLRKTKGGAQSTQASELQKLRALHPIIDLIVEHRELQKLLTTYIDVLPTLVDSRDGRIHTTYNQTGTVTGRLSSSNPNLQNIPARSEVGKKIKQAFVPDPRFVFCAFDYSQMQLRIAAHMSGDEKLIDAFRRNVDIHAMTAAEVNNISINDVTPELRREAKTLNFGVLYGMGARAFAESSGISKEKAREFIEEYFRDFSGLRAFLEALKEHAKRYGYVETLFGRRRYIPELQSPYTRMRLDGERMAINMPIQGTEADIMKLAMIEIEKLVLRSSSPNDICLIAQVHDELIFEVKKGTEEAIVPRIKGIMEGIVKLKVPVIIDTHVGDSWGALK
jgi:DNA polymerase-1